MSATGSGRNVVIRRLAAAVRRPAGLAIAAALVVGAAFLAVGGWPPQAGPLLVFGVLLLAALLILVGVFVLARNLVKLYLERSRGVPGSRYRTKVVGLVVALTLIPSLLLFVVAGGILRAALEQAFEPDREAIFRDGRTLVHQYELEAEANGLRAARLVAAEAFPAGGGGPRRGLVGLLDRRRAELGLAGLRVFDARGRPLASSHAGVEGEIDPAAVTIPPRAIEDLLAGRRDALRHAVELPGHLLLSVGAAARDGEAVRGAAVAVVDIGPDLKAVLTRLSRHFEDYERAKANRERVQQGFLLLLTLFTVLLLVGAVWVGSTLAKSMTVPIQRLAEATRAVSEGRFDSRVEVEAPDELGALVRSFNRMLDELREERLRVERSTRELQRSNVELDGRRHYTETLLESIPSGVLSIDGTGRISNLNPAAVRMFGFKERPAPGVHFRELFAAKEFLELRILIDKVMGIEDIALVRELHLRIDRRPVDLSVSFTALTGPRGDYLGLLLVLEDLSSLIKAQKIAAWREVARRIAHEIKNPLTPIQLSAQRIAKKWRESDPDVGKVIEECTETITQEVDGLKSLVNEFSRFARMPPVAPVPTALDKVVHSALMLYEGLHPQLSIERRIAADVPALLLDPEQMKRVLINLVDNAIECQGGRGRIVVSARHDPRTQSVRLEVADEGPGIAPEDRERLFVPYFSTKRSGTGLGLAIVHRIVSDHNGTIRVEDNAPRGARFVIDLPA